MSLRTVFALALVALAAACAKDPSKEVPAATVESPDQPAAGLPAAATPN